MKTDRPIKDFLAEAEDILESANQTLLSLETGQAAGRIDPDQVNALFRAIHSFKGLAGMFGLKEPSELSHKLEFLLDELRLGKVGLGRKVLDVVLGDRGAARQTGAAGRDGSTLRRHCGRPIRH